MNDLVVVLVFMSVLVQWLNHRRDIAILNTKYFFEEQETKEMIKTEEQKRKDRDEVTYSIVMALVLSLMVSFIVICLIFWTWAP